MNKLTLSVLLLSLGALQTPASLAQSQPPAQVAPQSSPGVQAPHYNKRSQYYRLRQECQLQAQQQGLSPELSTAYVQNCLQGKH